MEEISYKPGFGSQFELLKLEARAAGQKQLKHFRFAVREQIKQLSPDLFLELALYSLHRNHYPLLQEYLSKCRELRMTDPQTEKRKYRSVNYLVKSHRKTLTMELTSLEVDGYSAEVTEFLMLHKLWKN